MVNWHLSKQVIGWPVSCDDYTGLMFRSHRVELLFFKLTADQVLVFLLFWSQAQAKLTYSGHLNQNEASFVTWPLTINYLGTLLLGLPKSIFIYYLFQICITTIWKDKTLNYLIFELKNKNKPEALNTSQLLLQNLLCGSNQIQSSNKISCGQQNLYCRLSLMNGGHQPQLKQKGKMNLIVI